MKQLNFLTVALAALTLFSCSKDNEGSAPDNSKVRGLELTITGAAKSNARANGDPSPGVGDEDRVFNFGAFVKEVIKGADGNAKSGADGTKFVFRETTNYAATPKLSFGEVAVGSNVYVIVNYKPTGTTLVATTGEGEGATVGTLYTETEIKALIQKIEKADLNNFTIALQAAPTDPKFPTTPAISATNCMLMTGTSKVPTNPMDNPDAPTKVKVEVPVERQFVKINAGDPTVDANFDDKSADVVITQANLHPQNEETIYFLRRTSQQLGYFDFTKSEFVLPFIKDVVKNDIAAIGSNETLNDANATEYRYVYPRLADANKANMYATRNEATKNLGATAIVYRIGYKCDIDLPAGTVSETQTSVITNGTTFYRYYKAYVATNALDVTVANRKWDTGVGLFYQFSNTLIGWGYDTEDEAIDGKEAVDINVIVKMKDWTVKTVSVPMD